MESNQRRDKLGEVFLIEDDWKRLCVVKIGKMTLLAKKKYREYVKNLGFELFPLILTTHFYNT